MLIHAQVLEKFIKIGPILKLPYYTEVSARVSIVVAYIFFDLYFNTTCSFTITISSIQLIL